ncbi:MAG: paraquat-inducible protein A [Paracoccaceae bacterium]|nr:paraquat-inducible protein A [Paracoccaceae bacterium]
MQDVLRYLNLSLLVLFPISWVAPLLRAGVLPFFSLSEISVLSGIIDLWGTDWFLALVVALFAIVAPFGKTVGLALIHHGKINTNGLSLINILGKLAMADVFLIAIYITISKGIGWGRIETGWGLYLFTFCILASLVVAIGTKRKSQPLPLTAT